MKNAEEIKRWLRDARACLEGAEKSMEVHDLRTVAQNSQLTVELSTKAVIACFGEPDWTHDPSNQLLNLVEINQQEIKRVFGGEVVDELKILAEDTREIAPLHGQTVYGKRIENGQWIAAVDLCDKDMAAWALELAQRSFKTASTFIDKWFVTGRSNSGTQSSAQPI